MLLYACLLFKTHVWFSESAKILAINPVNSRSHNAMHQTILHELASNGHEIVRLSYFKSDTKATNFQEILLHSEDDISATIKRALESNIFGYEIRLKRKSERICSGIIRENYIHKLLSEQAKSHPFDLMISEFYFTKCYSLLAHKLNVPLIAVIPVSMNPGTYNSLGSPFNPSYTPSIINGYTTKMNFFQRLINSINYASLYVYQHFFCDVNLKQLSHILNTDLPSDTVLNDKIAFVFYNNHFSFISRPLAPNALDIGGVHIQDPKPLPEHISEFINSSKHGVILFSFGTTLQTSSIPAETMQTIVDVFSTIPQKVLWRVNELNVTNLPSNVKIAKWLPQRDILEHENVIAFISHCGIFSTFEAIHTATPVLAIPFVYDQLSNANILVEKEVAIRLNFENLNKKTLLTSIQEITNNKKYKENMLELSKQFRDRPIPPLNHTMYWIEHVMRHKGADHLRLPSAHMPLYQYLLLDVTVFIIILFAIVIYTTRIIIRKFLKLSSDKTKAKIQ